MESPPKLKLLADIVIGHVAEMVACLPERVVARSEPLSESVPKYALVDDA